MEKNYFFGDSFTISFERLKDKRGYFQKIFSGEYNFQEQYFSLSNFNTLRGIHFQTPPYDHDKLVYCISGKALDLIIDLRLGSPNYLKYKTLVLEEEKTQALFIPKGFGHGFLSMDDKTILVYNTSTTYNNKHDSGILWSSIGYDWPVDNPIVSDRDNDFVKLRKFESPFKYD
jgi:dTDP-4-dehydrorhamnose 3,5-epimerase